MRRRAAAGGSIALHVLVAVLLHGVERTGPPGEPVVAPVSVTLVELAPAADAIERPAIASAPARGGGGPAQVSSTGAPARPRRARQARRDPGGAAAGDDDPRGVIHVEPGSSGAGTGAGAGHGGGRGTGIGFGDGGEIRAPQAAPPPPRVPAGPPPSKARLARLIYPARHREVDDAELFIARVIIDHDGFVVGAKLVRGFGGRRDEHAAELIWKFRYAPALDDTGQPVRSILEQRFLVQ